MPGGRPKGYPKTGGRIKGTPNKFSKERLAETLEAAGIDPTKSLIKLLPHLQAHQQAGIYLEWQRALSRGSDSEGERTPPESTPSAKASTDDLLKRVLHDTHHANRARTTAGSR